MSASLVALSDQQARSALVARITARRQLLEAMAQCASSKDLAVLADDDEEDLKALAQLPGDNFEHICEKAVPLADRELEERVTFGELALIISIISDLTNHPRDLCLQQGGNPSEHSAGAPCRAAPGS